MRVLQVGIVRVINLTAVSRRGCSRFGKNTSHHSHQSYHTPKKAADGFGHLHDRILHLSMVPGRKLADSRGHGPTKLSSHIGVNKEAHKTHVRIEQELALWISRPRNVGHNSLDGATLYTPLTWHDAGDVGDNNGLPEDSSVEDVADSSVGGLPHLLQLEL